MRDDDAMTRALELGASVRTRTAPNPWVGCVLVAPDGVVVGEGATEPPGGRHAERVALDAASDRARGATAYVTLEPCAHTGRTGPCAHALVDAGVARVVVAIVDPDRHVAGQGIEVLRAAGVTVEVGAGAEVAAASLAPYLHHRRTGRASCLLKLAVSLDGKVAAADGTSQWLTGAAARADVHRLRAESQAIVVGSGTALADAPSLTVRDAPAPPRPPLRVLLDGRGRVAADGPLFDPALAPTLVATTERAPASALDAWHAAGAKVEVLPAAPDGGVDLRSLLALLGARDVLTALVEGGGTLAGAALAAGVVDRLVVYVAPVVLGERGHAGFATAGPDTLADATRFALASSTPLDDDVRLEYRRVDAEVG
ncbi:MAG TPA: bifunctional diaminohydroxyphosphoribosylaminopyrimidine deaminase/5-amino-6-(5-phosphoribosylamino)uracil reductase RibD [Acidimicrobiia bacterium]|nr:bifunctional diaminohydroxyphosphoribosylaminopyrimidine deaminase/5-amino-6-(5-phosphoribosylamino)uracil reductase RibD [Acidimicrobiia bacterium]